ncbi:MAG TPA: FHA domain-containing protein [Candidatus Aminicenantes bacterium]|nr:FHA domain-containing protein [Candidatus Aminicenantes bacterium]
MGDSLDGSERGGNGETVVVDQCPACCDVGESPLVFAWLIAQGEEKIFRIATETFTIGAASGNHLVLAGEGVLGDHCSIYWEGGRFEIDDHNTRGRTRVNDRPVRRQELADRDLVDIGPLRFSFHCFPEKNHG